MNRRDFLSVMLASYAAPAVVRAGSLMRIKPLLLPGEDFIRRGWPHFSAGANWKLDGLDFVWDLTAR